jgi:hypothetical protein
MKWGKLLSPFIKPSSFLEQEKTEKTIFDKKWPTYFRTRQGQKLLRQQSEQIS